MRNTILPESHSYSNRIHLKAESTEHVTKEQVALHTITSSATTAADNLVKQGLRLEGHISMRRVVQCQIVVGYRGDHVLVQHGEKGMIQDRLAAAADVEFVRDFKVLEELGDLRLGVHG